MKCSYCNSGRKVFSRDRCNICLLDFTPQPGDRRMNSGAIQVLNDDMDWVWEHRQVMEDFLGRELHPSELVRHIDKNRKNNDISNLEIVVRGAVLAGNNLEEAIESATTFLRAHAKERLSDGYQ